MGKADLRAEKIDVTLDNSIDITTSAYAAKAMALFKEGYNCSQAVCLAFADQYSEKYSIEESVILKLSSSFGGGMGRLREVCGAVTGMFMVAGILYGYDEPDADGRKAEHYARIQKLARDFEDQSGSIICRDLLGLTQKRDEPTPEKRTENYYRKRPCVEKVGLAAAILEQYIKQNDSL